MVLVELDSVGAFVGDAHERPRLPRADEACRIVVHVLDQTQTHSDFHRRFPARLFVWSVHRAA
jgi:hypothetical protein